jgi:hypothetical protein
LTEIFFTKVCSIGNTNLSVIKRKNSIFDIFVKRIYILFTRFRTIKLNNVRYVISRYYLIKLTKKLGIYSNFNFCFSHSGKYSAILISSDLEHVGVDIEYVGRRLSESLNLKIRTLYADLKISELLVTMILESLVKLSVFNPPLSLLKCLDCDCPIKIKMTDDSIFQITVNEIIVYSKIYTVQDLHICVTLESNLFNSSL